MTSTLYVKTDTHALARMLSKATGHPLEVVVAKAIRLYSEVTAADTAKKIEELQSMQSALARGDVGALRVPRSPRRAKREARSHRGEPGATGKLPWWKRMTPSQRKKRSEAVRAGIARSKAKRSGAAVAKPKAKAPIVRQGKPMSKAQLDQLAKARAARKPKADASLKDAKAKLREATGSDSAAPE